MFQYPEVHVGDPIEFAESKDIPETMWTLGRITTTKNNSVNAQLANGRIVLDVWHIGDPRLEKGPERKGTGVFKLTHGQIRINQMIAEHESMKRRMNALEQTFRAVEKMFQAAMESQGTQGSQGAQEAGGIPNPAGRRAMRPTSSSVGG